MLFKWKQRSGLWVFQRPLTMTLRLRIILRATEALQSISGSITKEVIRDGLVYDQQNVTILEIMGRNAGWLTGAAALQSARTVKAGYDLPSGGYL